MDILKRLLIIIVAASASASSSLAQAQEAIGVAAVVNNQVTGTLSEKERRLRVGIDVFENEFIKTSANSKTQLIFNDETVLTLGPDSQLSLDSMVYDPDDTKGEMVLTAAVGVFSFISGTMESDNYKIRTPTAIIGVRGTVFDLLVEPGGATTAILRQGVITLTNLLTGISQEIDTVGLASSIFAPSSPPTKPAPPSPSVAKKLETVSVVPSTGGGLPPSRVDNPIEVPMGVPTGIPKDVTDLIEPQDVQELIDGQAEGRDDCVPKYPATSC